MPRNPIAGLVSGVFGLAWGTVGLVLAAWVASAALDRARGSELALWALERSPLGLPWEPAEAVDWALGNPIPFVVAAAFALLLAWYNLRVARVAFRPSTESQDGKGQLQLSAREDPRVGKPFEGAILLREAPPPGDEFEVTLSGGRPGRKPDYLSTQTVRARQGAHGVSLPFRFEVPATAPADAAHRWSLEFAPAGRRAVFRRSAFPVSFAPAPQHEVAAARALAPVSPAVSGAAGHIERLYGAFGGRLSEAQRAQLHEKLAGAGGPGAAPPHAFSKLTPQHIKLIKYAFIGVVVLFFAVPFVLAVLGLVLGAIFG